MGGRKARARLGEDSLVMTADQTEQLIRRPGFFSTFCPSTLKLGRITGNSGALAGSGDAARASW